MCGRFSCHDEFIKIVKSFGISKSSAAAIESAYHPSYNIAPTRNILVITADRAGNRHLKMCRWGFVPSWAKDSGRAMINAKAETIAEKPAFREAFNENRCIIVANSFFEWRKEGTAKLPINIRLKSGEMLGFAGLYSQWKSPEGEEICTCAIITTKANELLSAVHDRMPAILPPERYDEWLHPKEKDKLKLLDLLAPYASEPLEYYDVSLYVNKPEHDSPTLVEPMDKAKRTLVKQLRDQQVTGERIWTRGELYDDDK